MTTYQILVLLFLLAGFISCKVSSKQVIGKYIDTSYGDTLQLNADKSYEYLEKLNKGDIGLTQGEWEIKNHKIRFQCDHKPLVGFRLKVIRDSLSNIFQIKLLLGDAGEPIYIEDVKIFKNSFTLSNDNFKNSKNLVKIFAKDFDSIVVRTFNFSVIAFPDTLNANYGYIAKIYPIERLYELDKVPFIINKSTLTSIQTKEYDNIFLSFKKMLN